MGTFAAALKRNTNKTWFPAEISSVKSRRMNTLSQCPHNFCHVFQLSSRILSDLKNDRIKNIPSQLCASNVQRVVCWFHFHHFHSAVMTTWLAGPQSKRATESLNSISHCFSVISTVYQNCSSIRFSTFPQLSCKCLLLLFLLPSVHYFSIPVQFAQELSMMTRFLARPLRCPHLVLIDLHRKSLPITFLSFFF